MLWRLVTQPRTPHHPRKVWPPRPLRRPGEGPQSLRMLICRNRRPAHHSEPIARVRWSTATMRPLLGLKTICPSSVGSEMNDNVCEHSDRRHHNTYVDISGQRWVRSAANKANPRLRFVSPSTLGGMEPDNAADPHPWSLIAFCPLQQHSMKRRSVVSLCRMLDSSWRGRCAGVTDRRSVCGTGQPWPCRPA